MFPFSTSQKKQLADYLSNLSVAWLTGGVIAPAFSSDFSPIVRLLYFSVGVTMSLAFIWQSLKLVKEAKND